MWETRTTLKKKAFNLIWSDFLKQEDKYRNRNSDRQTAGLVGLIRFALLYRKLIVQQ